FRATAITDREMNVSPVDLQAMDVIGYSLINFNLSLNVEWQKSLGGPSEDFANSVQQTGDGGYIVAGATSSKGGDVTENHGPCGGNFCGNDYWIAKLKATGTIEWQKAFGGSGITVNNILTAFDEEATSVHQTTDGGYIVAGFTNGNDGDVTFNHGGYDYWVLKLGTSGNLEWQKTYGGTNDDRAYAIVQT